MKELLKWVPLVFLGVVACGQEAERVSGEELPGQVQQELGLTAVKVVTVGESTCALTSTGAVYCWGDNRFGQLGTGDRTTRTRPTQVVGLTGGVVDIDGGHAHACAVLSTGALRCWGWNMDGRVGVPIVNSATNSYAIVTPQTVVNMTFGVTAVAAGNAATCAIKGGEVFCFGFNDGGVLGNNSSLQTVTHIPVRAGTLTGQVLVADGGNAMCSSNRTSVWCWGSNRAVLVWDAGATSLFRVPTLIKSMPTTTKGQLVVGSVACTTPGSALWCWGSDNQGLMSTTFDIFAPRQHPWIATADAGRHTIAVTEQSLCAIQSGLLRCTGAVTGVLYSGSASTISGLATPVRGVSQGRLDTHWCAIENGSTVRCWGGNTYGQLGIGSAGSSRTTPQLVLVP